ITDAEVIHEFEKLRNFALVASYLDSETLRLNVDNFGSKNITDLHDLGTSLRIGLHPKHHQFPVDKLTVPKILNFNHINQLTKLPSYLLQDRIVSTDNDRHARG